MILADNVIKKQNLMKFTYVEDFRAQIQFISIILLLYLILDLCDFLKYFFCNSYSALICFPCLISKFSSG